MTDPEFNSENWRADTTLTLCNVNMDSEYRDVVSFNSQAAVNSFIDALDTQKTTITKASYAKPNEPVRVQMSFNNAQKYNYLRASNPIMPTIDGDTQKDYYYFIVATRYIAPDTTELTLQLDMWTTYAYEIEKIRGYIERGHIGIANSKAMDSYGRDYLTVPEGLDIGTEYRSIATKFMSSMDTLNNNIVGVFATDPAAAPTVGGKPNYTTAKGSTFQGIPSGAQIYVWESAGRFREFLNSMTNYPWIPQGIMSLMIVPPMSRYWPGFNFSDIDSQVKGKAAPESRPQPFSRSLFADWRNSAEINNAIHSRYRHLAKLKTFPYMAIEMTAWSATPIILKPENWQSSDASIMERVNMLPPNARIQYAPRYYNYTEGTPTRPATDQYLPLDDGGSYWDLFTQIGSLPTIPIVNDGGILALANNANSLSYAAQSADWSQQKVLRGAATGYDQSSSAMDTNAALGEIGNRSAYSQAMIQQDAARRQALLGIATGAGGGAAMGGALAGPGGAAAGAASGLLSGVGNVAGTINQIEAQNQSLIAGYATTRDTYGAQNKQAAFVRDSNYDLAKFAAQGDYQNTIAGIEAKTRDMEMTPASVVGQMGGELINIVNGTSAVSLRWKFIDNAALHRIGDFWLRYGYAVSRFAEVPKNLTVMENFSYWKMQEVYLTGAFLPEGVKQVLRGILEKGVTVWKDANKIGQIDIADNAPLGGIEL